MPPKDAWQFQPQKPAAAALHAKFMEATKAHQQGRLADAERIYGDVLRQQPKHFEALHRLGIIAAQTGRTERAVELFRKAIKFHAIAAPIHRNLGIALLELGRPKEALLSFDKAIALKPDYVECHNSRGLMLQILQQPEDALAAYDKAIALKPEFAEAHYNRGLTLRNLQRPMDALAAHDRAIALKSNFPEAHYNRGLVLQEFQRPAEALAAYDKAIALKPVFAEPYTSRGNILQELRQLEDALASHDGAIALKPDFAEAHSNRSNTLMYLMRPAEALSSCDKAIALRPDFPEAYNNRGNILQDLKRYEEALAAYETATKLRPHYVEAYNNRSLLLLLMGRFEQGWREHEWRKKRPDGSIATAPYRQPLWLGEEDIAGKTLFIWCEQGFGDTIQFCRYAKLAAARGAKVIMAVQRPLLGLLKQTSQGIEIIDESNVPSDFDYHCPLMSLPLAFKTTLETIPAEARYIKSDEERRLLWADRLGPKTKRRIGLVFSGSTTHRIYNRSMPLEAVFTMLDSDIDWVCLQKEISEDDATALRQDGRIAFFGDDLRDFSDTAALLDAMDLVITIDTSVAHLAAAMGKPVWILLPYSADWRWLLDRNDSPWYPSARLFRQREINNWTGVTEDVKNQLAATAG